MDHLWESHDASRRCWTLTRETLPLGTWGITRFDQRQVVIADGLSETEAHCTLMHELVHVERGPVPAGREAQEEDRVSRIAARRLLPDLATVADALIWSDWCLPEAAEELGVDDDTLVWRLATLAHPAEIGYMRRRFPDEGDPSDEA